MKRLLLVLCLALCVLLAGCDTECGEGECQYWPTITTTEPTTATTENVVLNILDDCDYYLLIVVDRRDCNDGYEYIFQEEGQETTEDWFYIDELFSIGEYVLGIEYNIYDGTNREEFVLYDLE